MKPTILKIFYALLFIVGISGTALAQTAAPGGRVSGTLLDEHGKPMMFATTSLLNAKDSTIVKGAISNDAGVYVFEHVKDGQYLVKATTVGYDKATSGTFTISQASKSVAVPQITMQPPNH
jgi:hypothetical protein